MYRTVTPLAIVIATSVLASQPVTAQLLAPGQQGSGSQHSAGQAQQFELRANFDHDPVDGWEFYCQHAFPPAGNGRALATAGGGAAVWTRAGEFEDFIMQFRYGYERGIADVSFHGNESSDVNESYQLMLHGDHISLVRRQHVPDGTFPEKKLAAVPASLPPKAWHDVIIQVKGGQIDVWIDGAGVLSFKDPDPLRCGPCSLGVIAHSGIVLYDDVVLIADRPRYQDSLTTDPATWSSGSAAVEPGDGAKPSASSGASSSQGTTSKKVLPKPNLSVAVGRSQLRGPLRFGRFRRSLSRTGARGASIRRPKTRRRR